MKVTFRTVLFAGSVLLSCHAAADEEIVLGMSAAFTGPSRALGIELYRGSQAYLEKVNREGGVHGRRIVIRAYDDGYDPPRAISNTLKLIEDDNVFALFNYVGTPTVTRVLPLLRLYRDRHILLLFPFTGAAPQRQPPYSEYVLNLRASYADETKGLVDQFVAVGRTRIAVYFQADAYGRSGWEGVRDALAAHGLEISAEATYARGAGYDSSFDRQVEILRAGQPQAIISVCSYNACAGLIRDVRNAGWDVPIANLSFVASEAMAKLLEETDDDSAGEIAGTDYTSNLIHSQVVPSYEDHSLPAVWEYRKLMDEYGNRLPEAAGDTDYQPLQYSFVSLEGYLNARLLVELLERLGTEPNSGGLKAAAISHEPIDLGTFSPVSFAPDDNQGSDDVYFTTLENSRFVPLSDWGRWKVEPE